MSFDSEEALESSVRVYKQLNNSSENSADSITIKGKDLEALSDDPDEMQDELAALADQTK